MANTIQHKRGTAADWTSADPILGAGEFGFETDTGKLKLGDGSTAWSALGYFEPAAAVAAYSFQGENYGYTSGGNGYDHIEKFSFLSDGNSTSVGSLTKNTEGSAGQSSAENGYVSGMYNGSVSSIVEKFSFASDGNATNAGNLSLARGLPAGHSSGTNGYTSGGIGPSPHPTPEYNTIDKFPFASDGTATDVGDLTLTKGYTAGQSSTESGYNSGGFVAPTGGTLTDINKFSFVSDGNATSVGNLSLSGRSIAGQSSTESGYNSGGYRGAWSNVIDKFPFASDGNATDVGDLSLARGQASGQSSTENGHTAGGRELPNYNTIDKFPFASDGNATDVGDLTVIKHSTSGQQY